MAAATAATATAPVAQSPHAAVKSPYDVDPRALPGASTEALTAQLHALDDAFSRDIAQATLRFHAAKTALREELQLRGAYR